MGLIEIEPIIEEEVAAGSSGASAPIPGQMALFKLEESLPVLARLALLLTGIGIVSLSIAVVETIASLAQRATSWIPFFGSSLANGIHHGQQVLTNNIGQQVAGIDQQIGYSFHQLARVGRMVSAAAVGAAYVAARTAQIAASLAAKPNLAPQVHKVIVVQKATAGTVKRHGQKIATITKTITRPIPAYIPQRIHGLEVQVKRQQVEIAQLQKQVKTTPHPSTLAQAIPVVALGLAGLGLNASRCEGSKAINNGACEMGPEGINDLLSLLSLAAGFLTLREYTQIAQAATQGTTDVVKALLSVP